MRQIHFLPFAVALSLLASCASFADRHVDAANQPVLDQRVDDAMLDHVGDSERKEVADARRLADAARDAHAAAVADTQRVIDRRKLADNDLEIAQAELKRAEAAAEIAANGTQDELDHANASVADAKALVASARSRITLRDRQVDHANALEEVKFRKNELAQAKVEATKARVVNGLDHPQARTLDISAFDHQVRQCQEKVDVAQVRTDAAYEEVKASRGAYDGDVKAVPAAYRRDWPAEEKDLK